jgi:hypothetical protein
MQCRYVGGKYMHFMTSNNGRPVGRPWFVAIRPPPVMRAGHHQRAKVPLVPKAVECARLMLFRLV